MQDQSSSLEHTGVTRFLDACYRRPVDMTPVWFMRQAGHCLADYRKLRAEHSILTIARTPELCAQVSLLPIQQYGVDAAVMFTDIILPLPGMGIETDLHPEIGPIINNPVRTIEDVTKLRINPAEETTPFVMQAIRMVKQGLAGKQAVIGITGAPFTLALYIIEGRPSRDYTIAKSLMYEQPLVWHALLDVLTKVLCRYVTAQVEAGADAIQVFDTSVGILGPSVYTKFVQPYSQRLLQAIKTAGVPSIHFGTQTAGLLPEMAQAGGDVIGLDWRVDLDQAWQQLGAQYAVQGNMDPTLLLAPWEAVEEGLHNIIARVGTRPGHIFNLGHAILPATNPDVIRRLVDAIHQPEISN